MKELINIVNSKLQAVIDELKTQKDTLDAKVKTVVDDIDNKVQIASQYRTKVEESNNIITDLEGEINKLKKDLRELHEKFDSAGFTELLEAGNKEINGKIIEHNTKISQEQDNIKKYQEEAANLKDELTSLKESKANLENELNNTIVALNYYGSKIEEITLTSIENADHLSDLTPEEDSLDDTSTEDVDVNKVIDGTIFEEIDEISTGGKELSEEELNDILSEEKEEPVVEEKQEETITEEKKEEPVIEEKLEEVKEELIEEPLVEENEKIEEAPVDETIEETPTEEVVEDNKTDEIISEETNENEEENLVEEKLEEEPLVEETTDEVVEEIAPVIEEQPTEVEENVPTEVPDENADLFFAQMNNTDAEEKNDIIPEYEVAPQLEEPKVEEEVISNETSEIDKTIKEIGLDASLFDDKIYKIGKINSENAQRIIDVLDTHFIDLNNVYSNPSILVTMKPEVLTDILDLLELAGCVPSTINYIFEYLDKIELSKLRDRVKGQSDSIIGVLYDVVPNIEMSNIGQVLGLTQEQASTLQANLDERQYNIMCAFPEVVKTNYNTIKALNVNDPIKCITEHPKRFIFNPDIFESILDKYDPQDLVRCINKNVAVIDKL